MLDSSKIGLQGVIKRLEEEANKLTQVAAVLSSSDNVLYEVVGEIRRNISSIKRVLKNERAEYQKLLDRSGGM